MIELNKEQKMILDTVRKIAKEKIQPRAAEIDEKAEIPRDIIDIFVENGLLSPLIPEEYGGINAGFVLFSKIVEEISKVSAGCALQLISQADGIQPILYGGNKEMKERYLPGFVRGKIACFAATEPDAGSDIQSMRTRAVRKGDSYVINGQKCFITNGSVADTISLFAYTDPQKKSKGISVFVVDRGSKGLIYGKNERKMGMRGCVNSHLFFEDLVVPVENRVGEEGDGFASMMMAIETGRMFTASQAVGLAQGAIDEAVKYAKQRIQFGRPIAGFQAIQFMAADMVANTEAARLMTYQAAKYLDEKNMKKMPISCAMAKFFASDNAMKVTTDAVQIMGGYGYLKDFPVERMMRDAKLIQIYTGTNQIMRIVTAREIFKD
ncbi:MAG TPA: acyl-CoA dehydrogenase family protein [Desulfatiglandales bacterium]|nr:acyl-CoA dehydrogenase family protein [Desulfatiglandales bacterium]